MDALLIADSITKNYGDQPVLKASTAWAREGEVTCLMGRNGAGKTTLMRIAVGDLRADQGIVRYQGELITRPRLSRLSRRGMMFIPANSILPWTFTVQRHIEAMSVAFGIDRDRQNRAIELLRIGHLLEHVRKKLSGGERSRVSLALAMMRRPKFSPNE